MSTLPKSLQKLIEELTRLPGVGPKTASRFAFNMLNWDNSDVESFGASVLNLKSGIHTCSECFSMSNGSVCDICSNQQRDRSILAVVEKSVDVMALESTGDFRGLYHVLGGTLAPIEGVGPDDLRINELIKRIEKDNVVEVILATNADLEGETTAMYIARQLKSYPVSVTRIARGLPIGGELEYADEVTLTSALEGRREYGK